MNTRERIEKLALTGLSLAVIMAVQLIGLPNLLTGIAVNAVFVFVCLKAGIRFSVFLCFLSPFGGIMSGHLPAPMYLLIPVIILGNLILVLLFNRFAENRLWVKAFFPALAKGLFIGIVGFALIKWLEIAEQVKWLVVPVLGIQFVTALVGIILGERIFVALFPVRQDSSAE